MSENEKEKSVVSIYLDMKTKLEIETYFLYNCRIKNYQEGYREILSLGFKKFKELRGDK